MALEQLKYHELQAVNANDEALTTLRSTIASIHIAILQPIQEAKDLYGFEIPPENLVLIDRLAA